MAGIAHQTVTPKKVRRPSTEQMESSDQVVLKVLFQGATKRQSVCYVPTDPQQLRAVLSDILNQQVLPSFTVHWIDPKDEKALLETH